MSARSIDLANTVLHEHFRQGRQPSVCGLLVQVHEVHLAWLAETGRPLCLDDFTASEDRWPTTTAHLRSKFRGRTQADPVTRYVVDATGRAHRLRGRRLRRVVRRIVGRRT